MSNFKSLLLEFNCIPIEELEGLYEIDHDGLGGAPPPQKNNKEKKNR